ncbi:MAG: hypothetical protein F4066_09190 [Chloroflexi bacterium]|nr:hypothetical protein [Chloroflexota bacterium]MYF80922.1 hypothetical protein [Chloroflexota bacterium]MYI05016.1 hypothetical protein [Chloroflexota bacterium]
MKSQLFAVLTRRRVAGLAALFGAVVVLAMFAAVVDAQGQPKLPHLFWGRDAGQYSGATITAVNQDGVEVLPAIEGGGLVNPDGSWSLAISPDDARTVVLRLTLGATIRETNPLDVIEAEFPDEGLSIADFRPVLTKEIRVIARLHPTRALRTLEFNIRVGGVDIDPPPRARYLGPNERSNSWLQSSPIDAGDGFWVRVIACKRDNGSVIFGVRVDGHDDFLPRGRVFRSSVTHNRWLPSTPIEIERPGSSQSVVRLGRDPGCDDTP